MIFNKSNIKDLRNLIKNNLFVNIDNNKKDEYMILRIGFFIWIYKHYKILNQIH